MKKLVVNCFIFSFPLLICLVFFIGDDPFGVFYKNECLAEGSSDVIKTRDYTHSYLKNGYTSFIFGNSRTNALRNEDWQKYIGKETIFNYGCPGESLLNIRKKLELIFADQNIKNVLILVDAGILENTDNRHHYYQGPVYNHSPITSNISYIQFYSNYIKYYFDDFFFLKHIYYRITSSYKKDWMKNSFKDPSMKNKRIISVKYKTLADSLIETNFKTYKMVFAPDYSFIQKNITTINAVDSIHLLEIKDLLEKHCVNYKVLIPPDFSRKKISPEIYNVLNKSFGNKLYDFTGINRITTDSSLNYENLHFTYRAGQLILEDMYKSK